MVPALDRQRASVLALLASCQGILAVGVGIGQEAPELVTDRPDQTESAEVVPGGFVQLELGGLFTRDDTGGVRRESYEIPGSLLRVGLSSWAELRIGWAGYVSEELRTAAGALDVEGVADADIGAKLLLRRGDDRSPQVALLAAASLPVGDDELTSDRIDPSFRLAVDQPLGDRLGLGVNVGMEWETGFDAGGDRDTLSEAIYTVALGIDLTESWGAFVELFGDVPASAPGSSQASFDGGVTHLLRPGLQLDVAGGFGLTEEAADWFVGVGISVRWPE